MSLSDWQSRRTRDSKIIRFWRTLGPGLLWAAAAIGVSHLVQSTRAGADGGFSLVWVILLALAVKYPFFEYGPRYAAATGESLVEGYYRLGQWAVWTYLVVTIVSAVIIQSAIILFTSYILNQAFGLTWSVVHTSMAVIASCAILLAIGQFKALDQTIKLILAALVVCAIVAAIAALSRSTSFDLTPWPLADTPSISWVFVLALVGWMPSAIDVSVWSSLWTLAKYEGSGVCASMSNVLLDFRLGYAATGVIALAFLTLGATVMNMAGKSFSPQGAAFSLQLIDLFSVSLGAWARPVILVAVMTTMLSTSLTVIDGLPRAIARCLLSLRYGVDDMASRSQTGLFYWTTLILLAFSTAIVLTSFVGSLTAMVDFATLVAFVTGPILGYMNIKVLALSCVPDQHKPGRWLRVFSYVGVFLMAAIAIPFVFSLVL